LLRGGRRSGVQMVTAPGTRAATTIMFTQRFSSISAPPHAYARTASRSSTIAPVSAVNVPNRGATTTSVAAPRPLRSADAVYNNTERDPPVNHYTSVTQAAVVSPAACGPWHRTP